MTMGVSLLACLIAARFASVSGAKSTSQFCRARSAASSGNLFNSPLRRAELDHKIAPLGEPEFAQPLLEGHIVGLGARPRGQPADPISPLGRLGQSESGRGQCAAERHEESSSTLHLIILSDPA